MRALSVSLDPSASLFDGFQSAAWDWESRVFVKYDCEVGIDWFVSKQRYRRRFVISMTNWKRSTTVKTPCVFGCSRQGKIETGLWTKRLACSRMKERNTMKNFMSENSPPMRSVEIILPIQLTLKALNWPTNECKKICMSRWQALSQKVLLAGYGFGC